MLKRIFYILFLLSAYLYTHFVIQPVLHFHTQQPPFFNSSHFFMNYANQVGGIGMYISNYLMQLFHSNLYGSFVIVLLVIILTMLLYAIFKKLKVSSNLVFLYLPVAITVSLFHDYYFPLSILLQTVFIFLAVFIYIQFIKANKYLYLIGFLIYALLYYIFGSGVALIFGITSIIINYFHSTIKGLLIKSLVSTIALAALPFIAYKFIFNLSLFQAYFQFLPELPVTFIYQKSILLYLLVFLMPLILLLTILISKIPLPEKLINFKQNKVLQPICHFTLIVLFLGIIYSTSDKHSKNIAQVDFYTYHQNWDKAITLSLADKEYDFLTNLNYNRAIDNSGNFLNLFFDYPQLLGVNSIYPDNLGTAFYGIQTSEYYFDIGYISRSQHLAYGALVLEPYNARAFKQLVLTNLILGNFQAAKTYLDLLSLNPLYEDFVNKYKSYIQDTTKVSEDQLLSKKRMLSPDNFAIPLQITDRINDLIVKDSMNRQAFEHLQMCYLLEHKLEDFMNNFEASMKFYPQIPEIYEQALLIYIYSTRSRIDLARSISIESKEKFTTFLQILKDKNNNLQAAQADLTDFENTYIYYMKYLSPKVTNLEVITKK